MTQQLHRAKDMPPTSPGTASQSEPSSPRLNYLDGLRGLAALYVTINHAWHEIERELALLPDYLAIAFRWMSQGRIPVAVFIVLSGYSLMLPLVTRNAQGRLRGGFWSYLKRRAWRILPPYYAALAFSLALIAITGSVATIWSNAAPGFERIPAFNTGVLTSHLLLLHNLKQTWIYRINSPLWSVATEWQIYFFFPFVLIPIWRRFGIPALIVSAFTLGLVPHYLPLVLGDPAGPSFDWVRPWFLGLFALGMAGAEIGFSERPTLIAWAQRAPWGIAAALLWAMIAIAVPLDLVNTPWVVDTLVGVATLCLLIHCTKATVSRTRRPLVVGLCEWRPVLFLGGFSYSLYLIHDPVLVMSHALMRQLNLSVTARLALLLAIAVPLAVLLAYGFSRAIERPFMSSKWRSSVVSAIKTRFGRLQPLG